MKFKENVIKPGMVIHCLTIDEARTLSEHLKSMCTHNAGVILESYGKTEGEYPIDCIEINRSAGSGLYVTCSARKWYEQEAKRPITEFSDLIEPESRFKVGDKARVRSDLEIGKVYGLRLYDNGMDKMKNEIVTIVDIKNGVDTKINKVVATYYLLEEDGCYREWSEEMLEPVENSTQNSTGGEKSTEPIVKKMGKWECVYTDRGMMEGFQCDCGYTSLSASNYCPGCGKNMYDDSPINSDTDSPMSAAEVLEWMFENYKNGVFEEVFGEDYTFSELRYKYNDNIGEIIARITAYEAAKKAPKPVEVEEGYYCKIYTETDTVAEFTDWKIDEPTAKERAKEIAIKHAREWNEPTFADVHFVCRVKEEL